MVNDKNTVLFLGFGYTAQYLADILNQHGWHYMALSSRETINHLDAKPTHHNFDILPNLQDILPQITHIIVTAPPQKEQDFVLNTYKDLIISAIPSLKWLGYLSSTSVYGNHNGKIVTEDSELKPTSEHGKNRLITENLWQSFAHQHHIPLHIFRLSGIYGTDRNSINNVRLSLTINIIKQGHLMNRIYVKDIASALFLSMNNPTPNHIFNLADDMPASTAAVNDYIAFLLNTSELPKIAYDDCIDRLSDMQKGFYQDNKIVSNQKIKTMLGFKLKFPTYREGISDILVLELSYHHGKVH